MRARANAFSFLLFAGTSLCAQNLVPNPNFEQYTQCPDYVSQIDRCTGWSRPTTGTSDYFNACLGVPWSESVPDNEFGDQTAHSGNGYAGFYAFSNCLTGALVANEYREYVTHALSAPLVPGEIYAVEFFVSLADFSKYAVDDLGALFSVAVPVRTDDLPITAQPQVMNDTLPWLDSKSGWMHISGCFTADSAYQFITIGNFNDGANTGVLSVGTNYPALDYSYYYVEDVSVAARPTPHLGPDILACGVVPLTLLDPQAGQTYVWSTGATGASINVDQSGAYIVNTGAGTCGMSDTIDVTIGAGPVIVLTQDTAVDLCAHPQVTITAGPFAPDVALLWSTGAAEATIIVTEAGDYSLTATDPDGCSSHASIAVIDSCVSPLFVPNSFTPDGDGINDVWRPIWATTSIAHYEVMVFDRWGQVVFSSSDPHAGWDGSDLPIGAFTYRIRTVDTIRREASEVFGQVTLVR